jgi:hypothetical protein
VKHAAARWRLLSYEAIEHIVSTPSVHSMVLDLYQLLGVPPTATDSEIRAAYLRLARSHHPDVDQSPGADERFKAINAAFDVLSDPQRRSAYDAQRTGNFAERPTRPSGSYAEADWLESAPPLFVAPAGDSDNWWRSGRLWLAWILIFGLARLISSFMDGPDDNPAIVLGRSPTAIPRATQSVRVPTSLADVFFDDGHSTVVADQND